MEWNKLLPHGKTGSDKEVSVQEHKAAQRVVSLPLECLVLDDYQRATQMDRVDSIATDLDEVRLGVLLVSERDGKYYVVDGGHRMTAMRKAGYTHALCHLVSGLDYKREADYFSTQNKNSRQISPFDRFKAGVKSGDEMCMEINNAAQTNGFIISSNRERNARAVRCITALESIYKVNGIQTLEETFRLIRDTWDSDTISLRREFLFGVAEFYRRFGLAEFVERLRMHTTASLWRRYKELYYGSDKRGDTALTVRKVFCASLVYHYNIGIRRGSRRFLKMEDYYGENLS